MGVIGSAKLLQALARDRLIPGLSLFGQGTKAADEPIYAICVTFVIAQVTMFADINQIASFITMTVHHSYLLYFNLRPCMRLSQRRPCRDAQCHVAFQTLCLQEEAPLWSRQDLSKSYADLGRSI